jgi:radical SAM protein with 4Fe4S-binding SPASM domain
MTAPERKLSNYDWNERKPVYIDVEELSEKQQHRLMESKHFCMIPWIHMHGYPDGRAYPCCLGEETHPIGNLKQHTIKEIWNQEDYREMRRNMLADQPSRQCVRCYEQEDAGFASMRNNSNRHFGHHIGNVDITLPDGTHPEFEIRYWDIRFSNICNLKCRSCGSIFSSRWYDDDVKLHGKPFRPRVQYAGKTELDIWEQMQEHIPHLEQIYFAGGEPLIMEEHNRILKMLIETGNTSVRLIYNTNLTELKFKKESVLDLWKQFPQVCVAASLDDMGERAGIIRSGTVWADVEQNIQDLKRECPHIDFMISPTLSVMNIWNFCEFHRYMVEQEFIRPGDMNLNILQGPREYRIDILPQDIKLELKAKFEQHLEWLRPRDHLNRATGGFEAAIQFMMAQDRSDMLPQFWKITSDIDWSRNESILQAVPELERLLKYKPEGLRV